jgi:hypothetical protein
VHVEKAFVFAKNNDKREKFILIDPRKQHMKIRKITVFGMEFGRQVHDEMDVYLLAYFEHHLLQ